MGNPLFNAKWLKKKLEKCEDDCCGVGKPPDCYLVAESKAPNYRVVEDMVPCCACCLAMYFQIVGSKMTQQCDIHAKCCLIEDEPLSLSGVCDQFEKNPSPHYYS